MNKFIVSFFLFISSFGPGFIYAQNEIELGICDSLPERFYKKNYTSIKIHNDYGYCISPEKILDARIANFSDLKELTYFCHQYSNNNHGIKLPTEIGELTQLTSLETNTINAELFSITTLKSLKLYIQNEHDLQILQEEGIQNLVNLEVLELSFSHLLDESFLVKGISELPNLKHVLLFGPNQLLVDQIQHNSKIEFLQISYTKDIHFDFSELLNLKNLNLNNNNLNKIPPSVYNCKKLETLFLSANNITTIDDEIENLSDLRKIECRDNDLIQISEKIGKCIRLNELMLFRNPNLKKIPESIGNLHELSSLWIGSCQLSSFPKSLENCTSLKFIYADKNRLTDLNFSFSKMTQLEVVSLRRNSISHIDSSIFSLATLQELTLSENNLTSLPVSIGKMKSLTVLNINTNNIETLPQDIGELDQLEMLSAYRNRIKEIPASIVAMKNLNALYLGDNLIEKLPNNFKNLKALHKLEIQNNPFVKFPNQIYALKNIQRVWISKKQTKLSGYLPSLKKPNIIITR